MHAAPGGVPDPNGEFNAMRINSPGAAPGPGSTYIQAVTWTGPDCPQAATVVSYSESGNLRWPHYGDQTELFSHRRWATAWFTPAQVRAHAVSVTALSGNA